MRSSKGSHRIVVQNVEYRWRATGNDGYICIGIWPTNNVGPFIYGSLKYHETWVNNGDGSLSSRGGQNVITNRLIRRIIDHAIEQYHYDPQAKGKELRLKTIDNVITWNDAIRAFRKPPPA
jgi:hypothetical protein